ncbi:MAG: hypothetical protein RL329_3388 [Bacteroidota bacterium]|jgi:hypothetical protein
MPYSDVSFADLQTHLGIDNQQRTLFGQIASVAPSAWLQQTLHKARLLPIRSEKARSEAFVFPILTEMTERNNYEIIFYSGERLNAEKKYRLVGECDFIISKNIGRYTINVPIFALLEAKKNDFDEGIPQCAAQMVGARIFNQKMKQNVDTIYGCVTTADQWLFMKLEGDVVYIDTQKYPIQQLETLLGILQYIIDQYKH